MVLAVLTTENGFPDPWLDDQPANHVPSGGGGPVFHQPVLLSEALEQLLVHPGGTYVDATVGEGGHALAMLRTSTPDGRVLGIDRDPRSLSRAASRLTQFGDRFTPIHGNYTDLVALSNDHETSGIDGILMDLGVSSRQLEAPGYGLSFRADEPLDMRYDPGSPLSAEEIVNTYREVELAEIIARYGEEPRARRVAQAIVRNRPIETTGRLAGLVASVLRTGKRQRVHPATRTFQALRIAVNDELNHLRTGLIAALQLLSQNGRLVVISYHSLEDRIVKNTLAREAAVCICPPGLPVCVCGHQPTLKLVNRRIIRPSLEEVELNHRSRSARMRVAEQL